MERVKAVETDRGYTTYSTDLVSPIDSVRWAAVLAGIFTVLASIIFFTILGIALGLSSFDANDPRSLALGASVYTIIVALLSFALGGFIAARTAAVAGTGNAILNGGMVWIVTIALIVNFIGSGVGTLLGIAGNVTGTAIEAAAPIIAEAGAQAADELQANPEAAATAEAALDDAAAAAQGAVADAQEQLEDVTPQEIEEAGRDAGQAAWWALLALGVSAGAALVGATVGKRNEPTEVAVAR